MEVYGDKIISEAVMVIALRLRRGRGREKYFIFVDFSIIHFLNAIPGIRHDDFMAIACRSSCRCMFGRARMFR